MSHKRNIKIKNIFVCFIKVLNTTTSTTSEIWWGKCLQNTFAVNNQRVLILENKTRTRHRRLLM